MSGQHEISNYIENLPLKKSFGMGFRSDDVYEVICELTTMYNKLLSEAYEETEDLKSRMMTDCMDKRLISRLAPELVPEEPVLPREEEPAAPTEWIRPEPEPDPEPKLVFNPEPEPEAPSFDMEWPEPVASAPAFPTQWPDPLTQAFDFPTRWPDPVDQLPAFPTQWPEFKAQATTFTTGERSAPTVERPKQPDPGASAVKFAAEKQSAPKIKEREVPAMKDKELQHLKRTELLEILLEQSRENSALKEQIGDKNGEIAELKNKLNDKRIKIERAGSLAEASFMINGVLESAQEAAQQYLDNLQEICGRQDIKYIKKEIQSENYPQRTMNGASKQYESINRAAEDRSAALTIAAQQRCNAMLRDAEDRCARMEAEAKLKCEAMEREAEEKCALMEQKAKQDVETHWMNLATKMEEFFRAHNGLRELLEATEQVKR